MRPTNLKELEGEGDPFLDLAVGCYSNDMWFVVHLDVHGKSQGGVSSSHQFAQFADLTSSLCST